MVLLCDGRLVCGCADPYGKRVLGDTRQESVTAVWTGPRATSLRTDLNNGGSKFCGDCALKLPLKKDEPSPQRGLDVPPLPSRLYIECTAACNISCAQACCAPETGITRTRQAGMLDFDLFRRVVDEAGPSLVRIDFFNYGEAFLHKRAVEMCEHIKRNFPHIYLYTSTNGLAFSEEQVRRLVRSGIDEVTFSIDGATPESYATYRKRGDFEKAIRNLRSAADEKRTTGSDLPFINWRYILFTHNDSDAEMAQARTMAAEIGVDRLCWELTDHPEDMFSRRFVPGSRELAAIRREIWDDSNLGNAIPGATPRAEIEVRQSVAAGRSHRSDLEAACDGPAGTGRPDRRHRQEPLDAPLSRAGELRPAPGATGSAALRPGTHRHQPRLRARLASGDAAAGTVGRSADDHHRSGQARAVRAEVRSGERGD